MAIHVLDSYVSLDDYAQLCGISRRSVLNRIRSGTVRGIIVDGTYAVSPELNPPKRFAHYKFKKTKGGALDIYPELRAVVAWCNKKDIRSYPFLRAIITGKIDGWVLAGEVFARVSDLEAFRKNNGK